jgi:PAS domain S-box-containing protein
VTAVASGGEVVAEAFRKPFDVFVLDFKMPGNEGLVLVDQVKAIQPDVPIIILTGFASLPSAMNAVRLQLFDYIQKDKDPDHLIVRVAEAIRHTQLERKLKTSEACCRLLAENIQDVIMVLSPDIKMMYVSPSVETVLGYTAEEFAGFNIYEVVHPEDLASLKNSLIKVLNGRPMVDHEVRFRAADGEYVWLASSAKLVLDERSEPQELVCSSRNVTQRKRAEESLKASELRYQQLAWHTEMVREEERKRISRELHDDIGQILTALKIDLVQILEELSGAEAVRNKTDDMQALLSEGIRSVHSLCRRLRPGALDDLSLEDALTGLVGDWKGRNDTNCVLYSDVDDEALSDEVRTAVFRMVQEALTNVSRYARASQVEINLVADEKSLHVSVADNGCGMDVGAADKPTSFGLLGMRERVEMLGGTLCIEAAAGKGVRIEATIPLQ